MLNPQRPAHLSLFIIYDFDETETPTMKQRTLHNHLTVSVQTVVFNTQIKNKTVTVSHHSCF